MRNTLVPNQQPYLSSLRESRNRLLLGQVRP